MIKIAVYGKGGIGKSTTVSNVAVALAEKGLKVMQIGCDPKADSTIALRHGEAVPTVLDLFREKKQDLRLEDMVRTGYQGVICVEAGGPTPGLGCAGRGISTALEKLKETGAYEVSFSSGYDFDNHKMSMTTASLQRDLHCFNMSCSVVLSPYTSYNFTFRCNASTLTDALKYDKRSGYSNAVQWY